MIIFFSCILYKVEYIVKKFERQILLWKAKNNFSKIFNYVYIFSKLFFYKLLNYLKVFRKFCRLSNIIILFFSWFFFFFLSGDNYNSIIICNSSKVRSRLIFVEYIDFVFGFLTFYALLFDQLIPNRKDECCLYN